MKHAATAVHAVVGLAAIVAISLAYVGRGVVHDEATLRRLPGSRAELCL